jgi:hypothetical protein
LASTNQSSGFGFASVIAVSSILLHKRTLQAAKSPVAVVTAESGLRSTACIYRMSGGRLGMLKCGANRITNTTPIILDRGILFKFESFEQFYAEIGPKPTAAHQLDRIDNDKGYEPGNVRWATKSQNERNRRCDNCAALKARIKELENQLQISTNSNADRESCCPISA